MKALISFNEVFDCTWISDWYKNDQDKWERIYSTIENCQRVVEVQSDDKTFPTHSSLVWVDCPDNCRADEWYYKDNQIQIKPQNVVKPTGE